MKLIPTSILKSGTVRGLLAATAIAGFIAVGAPGAHAGTVTIGLQEAGVNGGAITTVGSGIGIASVGGLSYGTFSVNNISGTGDPILAAPSFDTNSIDVTTGGSAGTLNVYITLQDLVGPNAIAPILSAFTTNTLLTAGWTVTESTWLDNGNGLFTEVTPLGSATFISSGVDATDETANVLLGSLYSLTIEYTITSTGNGSANSTVNISPVPEPMTLALLGAGITGLGLVRRRRRQ